MSRPMHRLSAKSVEKALRAQGGNAARALEYLILTVARTGEVIGCEPEKEIDLKKAVWTVPARRAHHSAMARVRKSAKGRTPVKALTVSHRERLIEEPKL